ncbi:MAG: hypothetical protein M1823_003005 [Watsoniomyces obsoletus]|nr:MAG: hypothetical protein M1823_003005 [Watsoniomyces obsoletus]
MYASNTSSQQEQGQHEVDGTRREESLKGLEREMLYASSFSLFRTAVIMQGIVARSARGQASSREAGMYLELVKPFGEAAWGIARGIIEGGTGGGNGAIMKGEEEEGDSKDGKTRKKRDSKL